MIINYTPDVSGDILKLIEIERANNRDVSAIYLTPRDFNLLSIQGHSVFRNETENIMPTFLGVPIHIKEDFQ